MVNYANIKLWGKLVGAIALDESTGVVSFEYTEDFVKSQYELSPLFVPLQAGRVYSFPELRYTTFKGLPGFIADSLPDNFGNAIINRWLAQQGRDPDSYNTVERLLYQGSRAMGALEFEPAKRINLNKSVRIELDGLVNAAIEVLKDRKDFSTNTTEEKEALQSVLRVGTSAGGARAKAVIAYNKQSGEIRSGQVDAPLGFEHYLIKLDGVTNRSLGDPTHYGSIEYSYYKMALACGINMEESLLLADGKRRHFMTKRFDRFGGSHRIHMVSLCGIGHMDFNIPGAYSYEQLLSVMRSIHLTKNEAEEVFRRMVFNVIGRNQDDHTKNFTFLLDEDNVWRLSPAYDMTYSYNNMGSYTNLHQMSINGKRDNFELNDLLAVADNIKLKNGKDIIANTVDVFKQIDNYLEPTIPEPLVDEIKQSIRLYFF